FFSSRRRHTRSDRDWSSDVCSSDLFRGERAELIDLSKKITAEALGEILELKSTINTMVDQLRAFASEVTRVAREVGTEGRLGGRSEERRGGKEERAEGGA